MYKNIKFDDLNIDNVLLSFYDLDPIDGIEKFTVFWNTSNKLNFSKFNYETY